MQDVCFELTTQLSIQPKKEKILNLYDQVESIHKFGKGKKGYIALVACAMIIIRQDKVPLTLADVFRNSNQEFGQFLLKDLGKMFSFIVSSLKLQLPLMDFFCYFDKCIHALTIRNKGEFISRSQSLAEFSIISGLDAGRSKASICVTIVLLSLEAESALKPSKEVISSTSQILSTSTRQVTTRRREFIEKLIEYGRQWPFFDDLDSRNFSVLLGKLVDWGSKKEWKGFQNKVDFNPPAFTKSISNTAETFARIELVKQAINEQKISSLSAKDLLIAEYINAGYSEQEIADFNPLFRKKRQRL